MQEEGPRYWWREEDWPCRQVTGRCALSHLISPHFPGSVAPVAMVTWNSHSTISQPSLLQVPQPGMLSSDLHLVLAQMLPPLRSPP